MLRLMALIQKRHASNVDSKFPVGLSQPGHCTQDDEEADQDGRQGAHAQPQDLGLLHQLTVGPGVAAGAEAGVALRVVAVDAGAAVLTRIVQTLIPVLASLAIRGHTLATGAPGGG